MWAPFIISCLQDSLYYFACESDCFVMHEMKRKTDCVFLVGYGWG